MNTLLAQSKQLSSPLVVVPLLGIAVDVTLHLKGVEDVNLTSISTELKVINDVRIGLNLTASQTGILTLYSSSVLMSRTYISPHILVADISFFFHLWLLIGAVLDGPLRVHQNPH
jgi:hypothetical protein